MMRGAGSGGMGAWTNEIYDSRVAKEIKKKH
jgi:hypothetical protein